MSSLRVFNFITLYHRHMDYNRLVIFPLLHVAPIFGRNSLTFLLQLAKELML